MTYRCAKSLDKLLAEVNARFPPRSKASDGWIGDAAHATRDSDHNPWVKDGTVGVVTARDFTEDDAPGVPEIADLIVSTLVRRKDKRVKYVIHEGRIWRSYDKPGIPAWHPAPYTGTNSHTKHVHVSVLPTKALYDSTAGWGIYPAPATAVYHTIVKGDTLWALAQANHTTVARLQALNPKVDPERLVVGSRLRIR
jgi:hypothetical protein